MREWLVICSAADPLRTTTTSSIPYTEKQTVMLTKQFYFTFFSVMVLTYATISLAASLGKVEETNDMLFGRDAEAASSPNCGKPPRFQCLIYCGTDPNCEVLGYNTTQVTCGCPCQRCPNGKFYGATNDYKKASPLTLDQRSNCLDVRHPCATPY